MADRGAPGGGGRPDGGEKVGMPEARIILVMPPYTATFPRATLGDGDRQGQRRRGEQDDSHLPVHPAPRNRYKAS